MDAVGYYRVSEFELVTGWVGGYEPVTVPADAALASARQRFDEAVLAALQRPPCVIAFSGGRDSSAILAVAVELARRHGLDEPVAATHSFPEDEHADERAWQEKVVRHLDLKEWVQVVDDGSFDILGSQSREALLQHGVLWPALLNGLVRLAGLAPGGSFVVGEGGDEVLGIQRMTGINLLLTEKRRPSAGHRSMLVDALAPRPLARRRVRRAALEMGSHPWLPHDYQVAYADVIAHDNCDAPLRWDRAVVRHAGRRNVAAMVTNYRRLLEPHGTSVHLPFLDTRFLGAWAAEGGARGFISRTRMMRMLFHDVLPDDVLARTGKGEFSAVAFGPGTRAFMSEWDGTGLPDVVDAEVLRDVALSPRPFFGAQLLTQRAWLAQQGS